MSLRMKLGRSWGRLGMKYKTYTLSELVQIKYGKSQKKVLSDKGIVPIYGTGGLMGYATESLYDKPSVLIGRKGTIGRVRYIDHPFWTIDTMFYTVINNELVIPKYLFYLMSQMDLNIYNEGTTIPSLRTETLNRLEFNIPSLNDQKKVLSFLMPIDDKIHLNTKINKNLEEQLMALFSHSFAEDIAAASTDTCPALGDLVVIIDNRGKTPPLTIETFDYPIIDVGALKGTGRIIDFNNCTKFVNQSTYKSWFRSGHPKPWDILISTVGSLAEMKIFLGSKGCVAQNVVALRATSISPLYLYQYLRLIRSDLVAYNIGSVQPSIKVTHIVKHPIFVPERSRLEAFEKTAKVLTNQLYANYNENELLKKLRDALLPRLMSGEINVSTIGL